MSPRQGRQDHRSSRERRHPIDGMEQPQKRSEAWNARLKILDGLGF
jgi:hypothetical protein